MKVGTRRKKYIIWIVLFLLVIGLASFSNLNGKRVIFNRASESKLQEENNTTVNEDVSTLFSKVNTDERAGGSLTESQQNTEPPTLDTSLSNDLPSLEQTIEVIIGMSLQVVKNHCDLGDIDATTLRCALVERLALHDLEKLNENFKGTGKTFIFKMFDRPWDQEKEVSICGYASGGQTLPTLSCSIKNNKMLYITILHVSGERSSGGNTDGGSSVIRYTAPSRSTKKEQDHWENPETHLYSWEVLVHEVGHKVGMHHFPTVEPKDNEVMKIGFSASSLSGDEVFHGDLFDPDKRHEWAYELSKRCEFRVDGRCIRIYDVPNQLTVEFGESGGGVYTVYGDVYKQYSHMVKDKVLTSGKIEEGGRIIFKNIKTLFNEHEVLFIVIFRGGQQYYFWLNRMDLNLRYWKGETDKSVIYKELGTILIQKEPIFISGSVSSKLSNRQPVTMVLYPIKYSYGSMTDYTSGAKGDTAEIMMEPSEDIKYQFLVDKNKDYRIFAAPREEIKPVAVWVKSCSGKIDDKDVRMGCLIRGSGTADFVLSEKN